MNFKKYILFYTLVPLLFLTVSSTYYRFFVLHDYLVMYEGECNPSENSCFVGKNEEDNEEYFYMKVQRHADDLIKLCGDSVVGCEMANFCLADEPRCVIEYCSQETDGECKFLSEESSKFDSI